MMGKDLKAAKTTKDDVDGEQMEVWSNSPLNLKKQGARGSERVLPLTPIRNSFTLTKGGRKKSTTFFLPCFLLFN